MCSLADDIGGAYAPPVELCRPVKQGRTRVTSDLPHGGKATSLWPNHDIPTQWAAESDRTHG
jgi:hypothetical protein